ncbi:MAG TPA: M56 family metallopeptidase [Croceibacterium sp.]|nr:M56 family metallopeptidase [Croceibacterium sp.]
MTGWLLDTLLYTGILIGLVLMVRRPAARLLGPEFAYALWLLPFLRLLMPPIVLPASFAPQVAATSVDQVTALTPITASDTTAAAIAAPLGLVAQAEPAWTWEAVAAPLLSVWLGVALAFLGWRIVTYRRMRRELLIAARPVGESGRVRLVETLAVAAPVAFGVFDKVVALPPLFMAQHDRQARDLAIAHELAHHRGHDLLANFAAQALLAMHWFNPLAWAAWRAMRRDQEAACDARVLAGRDREDRVRYAALIASVAAGPRSIAFHGALAAPMAGPLFEKSIIHRLKTLSRSDITRRRRWLGKGLIATSVMALPLTASFSYAALAEVQESELPAAPLAPTTPASPQAGTFVPHAPPEPPVPPEAPQANHAQLSVPVVPRMPDLPAVPEVPRFDAADPQFEAKMEEYGRRMEVWGDQVGKHYAAQAEAYAAQAEAYAAQAEAHAASYAARNVPEVVESCDENEKGRNRTTSGRARVVICERDYTQIARNNLRQARNAIAANRGISEAIRAEIIAEFDEEIARLDR